MQIRRQKGFSLIEVLVALAVVAIALAAVGKTVNNNLINASYLSDRTLAHWVAMNKLNELYVTKAWPSVSETKDTVLMAEQEWAWQMVVNETPNKAMRRVDIEVGREENGKLIMFSTLTGMLLQP